MDPFVLFVHFNSFLLSLPTLCMCPTNSPLWQIQFCSIPALRYYRVEFESYDCIYIDFYCILKIYICNTIQYTNTILQISYGITSHLILHSHAIILSTFITVSLDRVCHYIKKFISYYSCISHFKHLKVQYLWLLLLNSSNIYRYINAGILQLPYTYQNYHTKEYIIQCIIYIIMYCSRRRFECN